MKSKKIRVLSLLIALVTVMSLLPFSAQADDAAPARAAENTKAATATVVSNDSSVVITVKPDKTSCGCGESISAAVSLRNINGTTTGLTGGFVSEVFVITMTDSSYNPVSWFAVQTASGLDAACKFTFPSNCTLAAGTYKITARKTVGSSTYFGEASFYYTAKQAEQPEQPEQPEPFIITQPKNRTVVAGDTAKFTVKADGKSLKYRWYVQKNGETDWTKISGATKRTLSFTAGKSMSGNLYRCEVSSGSAVITSEEARLTVVSKPKITSEPANVCVRKGVKATFKVKATGGNLKYQWYYLNPNSSRWILIANATKASYSLTAKLNRDGYRYRCLVSNKAGSVYTRAARLVVK